MYVQGTFFSHIKYRHPVHQIMRAILRKKDGHLSEIGNVVVAVEPTGVRAGILPTSTKSSAAGAFSASTLALECYMSANVTSDVWIAVFSQPSAGRAPMHAPDLPFPLCLALLPDTECVCVAFRCSATAAAFCHWPPGIVVEWLHLGLKQWHAAASLMQRAAQVQTLDTWLAKTFDSQWTLPTEHSRHGVAMAAERDIPPCRDAPALSTGTGHSMHDAQTIESDPCLGVYDILAGASVRTDVTAGSGNGNTSSGAGRKATSARAAAAQSRRLLVAAAICATAAAAAAAPAEDMDNLMSDDGSELDEDEALEDEEIEEDEEDEDDAEDELDAESDIGEDLVLPDIIAGEDKEDNEEDEDASSFDEDASSDADISE
jgi:hypothetical protein